MEHRGPRLSRRALGLGAAASMLGAQGAAHAFGDEGAFHPRQLLTGTRTPDKRRRSAGARWALEVVNRTSSPARLAPGTVRADGPQLLAEPFAVWSGARAPEPLTTREIGWLRRYLGMGGIVLVDDEDPNEGAFLRGAKEELARVLPDGSPISIGDENVVFRSFYLLRRATGRLQKSPKLEAIVRGGVTQVIFSPNDLLGALARDAGATHPFEVVPGGEAQREQEVRLAVNVAMFVLCSNYKDDQVHAPFLMRRRGSETP